MQENPHCNHDYKVISFDVGNDLIIYKCTKCPKTIAERDSKL